MVCYDQGITGGMCGYGQGVTDGGVCYGHGVTSGVRFVAVRELPVVH